MAKNDELIQLCCDLVRLPSVNPQDQSRDEHPYGEKRMADYIFEWLDRHHLNPVRQAVKPGRDNIFSVAEGNNTTKTLLLCAHMDTVDIQGMTVSPFDPDLREGKIFGRGSCDDKGPLAALMIAFQQRVSQGNLPYNLALLASCDEEYNLGGSRYFVEHLPGPISAVLIAEPTELNVITAHKGVARLRMTTTGQSVHSAMPHLGQNAIYAMTDAVGVVKAYAETLQNRPAHPLLGHETLSITIIQGGQQINIIPDRCIAEMDWRVLPGRTPQDCYNELAKALEPINKPIELELLSHYEPMFTDEKHPMVQSLLVSAKAVTGEGTTQAVAYATDAGAFTHLNIPTAVFGPGRPVQAHTPNEFIEIDQLEKGLEAFGQYLQSDWGL